MRKPTEAEKLEIERMIDALSVYWVLHTIAEICAAKASHVAEHWQDMPLAKAWDKAASLITAVCERLPQRHYI